MRTRPVASSLSPGSHHRNARWLDSVVPIASLLFLAGWAGTSAWVLSLRNSGLEICGPIPGCHLWLGHVGGDLVLTGGEHPAFGPQRTSCTTLEHHTTTVIAMRPSIVDDISTRIELMQRMGAKPIQSYQLSTNCWMVRIAGWLLPCILSPVAALSVYPVYGRIRRRRRARRGECTTCEYSLQGLVSKVCPECGTSWAE